MSLSITNITLSPFKEDPKNPTEMIKDRIIASYVVSTTEGSLEFKKDRQLPIQRVDGKQSLEQWWRSVVSAIYLREGLQDPFA